MMLTKTGGRWLTVNPKHCDYQLSIVLTLVNVTIPLGYRRQYTRRETRMNIHILLWSYACVCCNMSTYLKHVEKMDKIGICRHTLNHVEIIKF